MSIALKFSKSLLLLVFVIGCQNSSSGTSDQQSAFIDEGEANISWQDGIADSPMAYVDPILKNNGTIDWAKYTFYGENYHNQIGIEYRLGPDYSSTFPSQPGQFNLVYQPDPDGLWKGGNNLDLANKFCRTPDKLIQSDSPTGYGNGFGGGGGWQLSGQMLFIPDADSPSSYRLGVANMRAFDGARAARASDGSTEALCLRMRAEWLPDFWNRNNISNPATPAVSRLKQEFPNLPLPAIATARGEIQNSVTGFLAFQNGIIAAAGTGNDSYCSGFGGANSLCEPWIQLPAGKVPTALALTAMNEFLFATVWDVNLRKGQLAVIAIGPNDPANIGPSDTGRYGWGVQSWPEIRSLKLLGFVDLPFAAPNTLSVALSTGTMKFRGFEEWRGTELLTQAGRNRWNQRSGSAFDSFIPQTEYWKMLAGAGYAAVGSRAESKVAIVDLRPLLNYYRSMYLTTKENWDQTANSNQGPADHQWPYTFAHVSSQRPTVLGVLDVQQPTAIYARQIRNGTNTLSGWDGLGWNELSKRLTIASMSGEVAQYNVETLIDPSRSSVMPTKPLRSWRVGFNPTQITTPIAGATRTDDLYIVSRATREVYVHSYDGERYAVLNDQRLIDPVALTIGPNGAGFGGAGKGRALSTNALTILDHKGKKVHSIGIYIENYPSVYQPGRLDSWFLEQWSFVNPKSNKVERFNYGYGNALPGKPFMYSMDEVI